MCNLGHKERDGQIGKEKKMLGVTRRHKQGVKEKIIAFQWTSLLPSMNILILMAAFFWFQARSDSTFIWPDNYCLTNTIRLFNISLSQIFIFTPKKRLAKKRYLLEFNRILCESVERTYPHNVPNSYDLLSFVDHKRRCLTESWLCCFS